jgi:hypothetical protein
MKTLRARKIVSQRFAMLRGVVEYREEACRAPCAAAPDTGGFIWRIENESDESDEIAPAQPPPVTNTTVTTAMHVTNATAAPALQAQARSDDTPSRPRGAGCGLGWSDEEVTAIIVQGYDISSDPVVGAGQTAEKYADRIRAAFLEKVPSGACSATGTKCVLDNRQWRGRPAAACLRKYKEVVRVCTRVYELRNRVDGLHLTGGPSEDDLGRVSLALLNSVATIGNRELIYTIASTPGFNIGRFEYATQYEFLSKHKNLLESGTTAVVPSTSLNAVATTVMGAEDSGGLEVRAPATERPLGNKAAKRSKRARESLGGSEVATSVREFSERLQESDESHARRAEENLKLEKQSHLLEMYQTLFEHESSTASQEEKVLAERRLRRQFFSSLGDEASAPSGEYENTGSVVGRINSTPSTIQTTAPPALLEGYPRVAHSNVPHVHGSTEAVKNSQDSSQ